MTSPNTTASMIGLTGDFSYHIHRPNPYEAQYPASASANAISSPGATTAIHASASCASRWIGRALRA